MKTKIVLAKGRYGMGGRINVLLSAMDYSLRSNRSLVVDWSDGYYGSSNDTISQYFTNETILPFSMLFGEKGQTVAFDIHEKTVYPESWGNDYHRSGYFGVDNKLYMVAPPSNLSINENIVVVTWVSNVLTDERLKHLANLLKPVEPVQWGVDHLFDNGLNSPFIGVHYRHGNGEKGVICPNYVWFDDQILSVDPVGEMPILLCTDSIHAQNRFRNKYGERVFYSRKSFPAIGPLHNNKEVVDRYRNGIDTLIDLYSLARSTYLIDSGEFFGKTAWLLGGESISRRFSYPGKTRMFNSQASLIPGGLVPLESINILATALSGNDIKLDNLFCALIPDGAYEIYYGDTAIGTFILDRSSDIEILANALLERRLYI